LGLIRIRIWIRMIDGERDIGIHGVGGFLCGLYE
jgi:hypothetical protein